MRARRKLVYHELKASDLQVVTEKLEESEKYSMIMLKYFLDLGDEDL